MAYETFITDKNGKVRRKVWAGRFNKWVFATMNRYYCPICNEEWGYNKGELKGERLCLAHERREDNG